MNLKHISNIELNETLQSLVRKERALLSEILWHIHEVDRRRLFLEMGFSSLFSYLTEFVGYSAGCAQRRIDAARLLQELPEVARMLESGQVNLSQVSLVQQSAREAKKLHQVKISSELKQEVLLKLQHKNKAESQGLVSRSFDIPVLVRTETKYQSDESVRIEMSFSKQQWQKIQQMQEILSHSVQGNDLSAAITYLAEKVIQKKYGKQKFAENFPVQLAHNLTSAAAVKIKTRQARRARQHIPSSIKRQVFSKYSCCQYRDRQSGKICGERRYLQIEHIRPIWAGGSNDPNNLSLLCANHNRHLYSQQSSMRRL